MELQKYTNDFIEKKAKLNLKLIFIILTPLVLTTILFITNTTNKLFFQENQWFNHLMIYVFGPIIIWSLFAAQRNNLVGAYGETILLLIPTFIWLLPGHKDAISWMISLSFIIIIISGTLFSSSLGFRFLKLKNKNIVQSTAHVFARLSFVLSSVVATLMISVVLINWADHSMHWGYTYEKNGSVAVSVKTGEIIKDFTNASFITFISVTTIFVALLLVSLGLFSSFNKHFQKQNNISATQAIKMKIKPKGKTLLEKTKIIKLPKRFRSK